MVDPSGAEDVVVEEVVVDMVMDFCLRLGGGCRDKKVAKEWRVSRVVAFIEGCGGHCAVAAVLVFTMSAKTGSRTGV